MHSIFSSINWFSTVTWTLCYVKSEMYNICISRCIVFSVQLIGSLPLHEHYAMWKVWCIVFSSQPFNQFEHNKWINLSRPNPLLLDLQLWTPKLKLKTQNTTTPFNQFEHSNWINLSFPNPFLLDPQLGTSKLKTLNTTPTHLEQVPWSVNRSINLSTIIESILAIQIHFYWTYSWEHQNLN